MSSVSEKLRRRLLGDETSRLQIPMHGDLRVAVGYPNTYHVAQSSLSFQWVVELASQVPGIGVERFFADEDLLGRSLDSGLGLGQFQMVAWSCSFELDAVHILRSLEAAGIPMEREHRGNDHPLIVVGGAVASINPLPLSPAVDVFCLGAAELLWPRLLGLMRAGLERRKLLETLADEDGFFVPALHLDQEGRPTSRLRRLEKRDAMMADHTRIPSSHLVTPNTEYARRGLVEISRGCPEKCRYCWVSYNYGRLRCYPTEGILDKVCELRSITDRVGLVATAVGDHPELATILEGCRSHGMNVALSSLRIPAMVPEILTPLAESGTRSVTIAPETGTDRLREALRKPIPNRRILEAVDAAQRSGIPDLKMYFIVGLPGETDEDVEAIASLARNAQEIMTGHGRGRGHVGSLQLGVSVLVPKPYTPYRLEGMLSAAEARRRLSLITSGLRSVPSTKLDRPSYREALWQACLSRGDASAFNLLRKIAAGEKLGRLMSDHKEAFRSAAAPVEGNPSWHFISSAPSSRTQRLKKSAPNAQQRDEV